MSTNFTPAQWFALVVTIVAVALLLALAAHLINTSRVPLNERPTREYVLVFEVYDGAGNKHTLTREVTVPTYVLPGQPAHEQYRKEQAYECRNVEGVTENTVFELIPARAYEQLCNN